MALNNDWKDSEFWISRSQSGKGFYIFLEKSDLSEIVDELDDGESAILTGAFSRINKLENGDIDGMNLSISKAQAQDE